MKKFRNWERKTECKNVRENDGRPPAPLFTGAGWLSFGRARAPALYSKWEWCPSAADELQFNIPRLLVFLGKVGRLLWLSLFSFAIFSLGGWLVFCLQSTGLLTLEEIRLRGIKNLTLTLFVQLLYLATNPPQCELPFSLFLKPILKKYFFNAPTDHLGMAKDGKSQLWVNASTSSYNHPCFGWFRVENASIFPKWLLWLSWELVSSW